jgi:hypothetical protein
MQDMDNVEKPIESEFNNPVETNLEQNIEPETNPIKKVETENKNKIVLIMSLFLALALVLLSSFLVKKYKNNKDLEIQENNTKELNQENEIEPLTNEVIIENIFKENLVVVEKFKDKFNILGKINSEDSIQLSLYQRELRQNDEYQHTKKEFIKELIPEIDKVFIENGFNKDNFRSVDYLSNNCYNEDHYFCKTGDYIYAYQKDDIDCFFYFRTSSTSLSPSSSPDYIHIWCKDIESMNNQVSEMDHKEIIEAIDKRPGKYDNYVYKLDIVKLSENKEYVLVEITSENARSGRAILAKVDNVWTFVEFASQAMPMCETLNKYKVPLDFVGGCDPN